MGNKSKGQKAGNSFLDHDILFQVLSRLPVKPLLRCKAVSKAWLSLISSPSFTKLHLNRAVTSPAEETLIGHINTRNAYRDDVVCSSFALFKFSSQHHLCTLKFPYCEGNRCNLDRRAELVGSDCGVVCVCVDACDDDDDDDELWPAANRLTNIYLWNPATSRAKRIAPHSLHGDSSTRVALGFGFDRLGYDFKVVRVVSCSVPVEIYSAIRDSWEIIRQNPSDTLYDYEFHVCLHGFLLAPGNKGMMAFDLHKEVFVCNIELPISSEIAVIVDLEDSVAVCNLDHLHNQFSLWTLDDEACLSGGGGSKASWTMKFSVDLGVPLDLVEGVFNRVEFLIQPEELGGVWFSFNSEKKVGKNVNVNSYFESGTVVKYTASLLSVAGSELIK